MLKYNKNMLGFRFSVKFFNTSVIEIDMSALALISFPSLSVEIEGNVVKLEYGDLIINKHGRLNIINNTPESLGFVVISNALLA